MSNKPQARPTARPEDLPTPDGLDLQPAVHLAMDLEEIEGVARRPGRPVDLPLPELEEDTEDLEQDTVDFVLLDRQGQPVPGVSATPPVSEVRDAGPTPGETALRDWRLRAPSRKAEALEAERQHSLIRTLQGSAALMALLLITTLIGVRWWRTHQVSAPPPVPQTVASTALMSPSPVPPPPQAQPKVPTQEAAPAAPAHTEAPSTHSEAAPNSPSNRIVDGTLRHWTGADGYLYWQWDYQGAEPLDLQWRDAAGAVRMQDRVCDGRIDATTGRCYVGRSAARFQSELGRGAEPGPWTLESCLNGVCGVVSTFEIPPAG